MRQAWQQWAGCTVAVLGFTTSGPGGAEELPPVVVDKAKDTPGVIDAPRQTATHYELSGEALEQLGAKGGTNPYAAMARIPGAQAPMLDAYGLVNQQGGNKGLRIRGEITSHGANGTVEGVPLNGPGAGPGYLFMLDQENIDRISMVQGPIPPDRFSRFDLVGQLDTTLRWGRETFGGLATLTVGEERLRRVFGRLDTGEIAPHLRAFVSASTTSADKWRGTGESPKGRDTFAGGVSYIADRLDARLFVAYSDMQADNYKGLTYAQTQTPDLWTGIDYDAAPKGSTAAQWANWQGYNHQDFRVTALMGAVRYQWDVDTAVSVQPFYATETGTYAYASGNFVRLWDIDHATYGLVTQAQTRWADVLWKAGYAWVSMDPPGPPTRWKHYTPDANGGLTFASWNLLADVTSRHDLQTVFFSGEKTWGAFNAQAGLRWVHDRLPGIDYYDPKGVGDVSFDTALSQSAGVGAARSVSAVSITEWTPFLGMRYVFSPAWTLRASAGRNVGTPALDAFQSAPITGMTKQQLWAASQLELADTVDLGVHYQAEDVYVAPTVYYTRYRNKGVSIYDPALKASYNQNIGRAHQTGLLLAAGWRPMQSLDLFVTASWMRSQFDEDLYTTAAGYRAVEGQQLPDVPTFMASAGGQWRWSAFSVSPTVAYMGRRYSNIEHTESMDAYTVANLDLGYDWTAGAGTMRTTLSILNLFDRRYIGYNNANETSDGSSYYPGAPRTALVKVAVQF